MGGYHFIRVGERFRVLFRNVPNQNIIPKGYERIFIVPKGLGFEMSNL